MDVICLPDKVPYPNGFITIWHVSQSPKLKKKNVLYCSWFDAHERLQKLHQQAILEAREVREESVKEMIMSYNKVCTGFFCINRSNIYVQELYLNDEQYQLMHGHTYIKLYLN